MFTTADFIPNPYTSTIENGNFEWSAPSNIALVKYWGKKDNQIPANPSVSFTLNNCKTITKLGFSKKSASASGMAALAMNFMSLEKLLNPEMTDEYFYQKASFLARLGSGSACRSVKGKVVVWGNQANIEGSSDLFGVEFPYTIHENFKNYQDTILLVDKGEKQVSSTVGHDLMHDHPYAERRFAQAHENLDKLIQIFENGNLDEFIKVVESEALTLHAMMMTSMPYFILMKPNTLQIINAIWKFRQETQIPVCFTLDAGANVHVLYPEKVSEKVLQFIQDELVVFCQNRQYICDKIGNGSVAL